MPDQRPQTHRRRPGRPGVDRAGRRAPASGRDRGWLRRPRATNEAPDRSRCVRHGARPRLTGEQGVEVGPQPLYLVVPVLQRLLCAPPAVGAGLKHGEAGILCPSLGSTKKALHPSQAVFGGTPVFLPAVLRRTAGPALGASEAPQTRHRPALTWPFISPHGSGKPSKCVRNARRHDEPVRVWRYWVSAHPLTSSERRPGARAPRRTRSSRAPRRLTVPSNGQLNMSRSIHSN